MKRAVSLDRSPLALTVDSSSVLRMIVGTPLLEGGAIANGHGQSATAALDQLQNRGMVRTQAGTRRDGTPVARYVATRKGVTALDRYDAAMRKRGPGFVAVSSFTDESYKCPELGRTCQRPGAYDAFALPSLIGKVRVMPKVTS